MNRTPVAAGDRGADVDTRVDTRVDTEVESEVDTDLPVYEDEDVRERDIAVVGMAGRFPGGRDLDDFWRMLAEGREAVTTFSDEELRAAGVRDEVIAHPDYVKAGSVLDGVEEFDAGFFGYTAREAEILDPQQRLFLEHAWAAMEDAGHDPARYPGLVGIYAGVAWNTYLLSNLREHRELFEGSGAFQVFITNDKDFMPTRASYKLDLKGPSMIVQTSCSTSLVAIHMAALSLLNYECDMALAGGVTVKVPQVSGYFHEDGGLASPDGHCRAFDADAAGTIFGSGVGIVVLKRLSEALQDGDTIRAVLRGSAINNDGAVKVSYTAPSVEGQAEVVATALAVAEAAPSSVGYVECHGTGTSLGDPIEVTALSKVFRQLAAEEGDDLGSTPRCALGSVKSNVGHLDAAAGVAGFIKTVLALEHGEIPPTVNFSRPNPRLDLESSPFRIADALADWPAAQGVPRRAGVSSFGVGGTNAHAVLEEAPAPAAPAPSRAWQLLPVSARSPEALEAATANLGRALAEGVPAAGSLADVSFTLTEGRRAFAHRRFLVAGDAADAARRLSDAEAPLPLARAAGGGDEVTARPVAFLFPGQGAQHPDMARRLYEDEAVFREALDEALDLYRGDGGGGTTADLRGWLFPAAGADPEAAAERLRDTAVAQPALFAVEYALARLWISWGVEPAAMLGHSLGELVAACLAGVFSLADGMALVTTRGRLMAAAPEGSMLAVPLPAAEVEERLASMDSSGGGADAVAENQHWAGQVELAAVNQPDRVTVSGPEAALAAFAEALAADGIQARPLHTSHAFHSASMETAMEPFRAAVAKVDLAPPSIPFVSNLTGTWITDAEATDPGYWARHLRATVRFADGLATLLDEAGDEPALLEVGPGDTLSTLARRHPGRGQRPVISCLPHPRQAGDGRRGDSRVSVLEALGRLWMAGAEIDWPGYWSAETRRRLPLPSYPFERRRYWIDAGDGSTAAPRRAAGRGALHEGGKVADPGNWFHRPAWSQAVAPRLDGLDGRSDASDANDANDANDADTLPRRWWLLAEGELGDALVERLAGLGLDVEADVHLVTPSTAADGEGGLEHRGGNRWALRPAAGDDWAALAGATGGAPDAVVHAWSTGAPRGAAEEQERGFLALAALLRGLGSVDGGEAAGLDLTVAAEGLLRVSAGEPLVPARATLLGLLRVAPEERPGTTVRALDVAALAAAPPGAAAGGPETGSESGLESGLPASGAGFARLASAILAEIITAADAAAGDGLSPEAVGEIALRGPQRWLRTYLASPLPAAPEAEPVVRRGGAYLVTGGLGGDGLSVARWLARRGAGRLLLVNDTAAPAVADDAEARRRADALAEAGPSGDPVKVEVAEADLADAPSLAAAVGSAAEALGVTAAAFDGVFHCAADHGNGALGLLTDTGRVELARHLRPRLTALAALEGALSSLAGDAADGGPRAVTVTSSLATVLGGLAYGAHTAAALATDAWVEERNRRAAGGAEAGGWRARPWLVVDLDLWQAEATATGATSTGATSAGASAAELAELAMTAEEGGEVLERALAACHGDGGELAAAGRLLVSTAPLAARLERRAHRLAAHAGAGAAATAPGDRHPRPQLDVPFTAPESDQERRIAEVWSELLGFDRIGLDDNFFELGGDSFVAVRVASRLKEVLGTELPVAQLYEALTVRALARLVEETAGRQDEREAHLEERRQAKDRRSDRLARRRDRIGASR